jgi:hypothetical protein
LNKKNFLHQLDHHRTFYVKKNVSNTKGEAVKTSIDIIRISVVELTPNVLVSPTEETQSDHFD